MMRISRAPFATLPMLLATVLLPNVGCSGSGAKDARGPLCEELPVEVFASAARQLNVNEQGQPLPVEVKVYLLKQRSAFDQLDFETAWQSAEKALGKELMQSAGFTVFPGKEKIVPITAPTAVRFVAFVGLFRDPHPKRWREVVDIRRPVQRCQPGGLHIPIHVRLKENRIWSENKLLSAYPPKAANRNAGGAA